MLLGCGNPRVKEWFLLQKTVALRCLKMIAMAKSRAVLTALALLCAICLTVGNICIAASDPVKPQEAEEDPRKKLDEEIVKAVPATLLKEIPPELWTKEDLERYLKAQSNIDKGEGALNTAKKLVKGSGEIAADTSIGRGNAANAFSFFSAVIGATAAGPPALYGALRRAWGRWRLKKALKHLEEKKKKEERLDKKIKEQQNKADGKEEK